MCKPGDAPGQPAAADPDEVAGRAGGATPDARRHMVVSDRHDAATMTMYDKRVVGVRTSRLVEIQHGAVAIALTVNLA